MNVIVILDRLLTTRACRPYFHFSILFVLECIVSKIMFFDFPFLGGWGIDSPSMGPLGVAGET